MAVVGIISEYNPFHSGHRYQIQETRRCLGEDAPVICVMSGNWVQRGVVALTDKWTRTAMALRAGVDLVLELPTVWATASAESFAGGGVSILDATGIVDTLSFGSESGALTPLYHAVRGLSMPDYPATLRTQLDYGLTYPAARQAALSQVLGGNLDALVEPNNNLGIEYLRALEQQKSTMTPLTIRRIAVAHDSHTPSQSFASASFLRHRLMEHSEDEALLPYMTKEDLDALRRSGLADLHFAQRAVFARLRTLSTQDFLRLPDAGNGLHLRLQKAAFETNELDVLYDMVKTRRYTHARIRRMVLWAFLGLGKDDRPACPPYLRVLGFGPRGRTLLRDMKTKARLPIITKPAHTQRLPQAGQKLFQLEARCTALYDLCRLDWNAPSKQEYRENPVVL